MTIRGVAEVQDLRTGVGIMWLLGDMLLGIHINCYCDFTFPETERSIMI